jgi:hypothetical protein
MTTKAPQTYRVVREWSIIRAAYTYAVYITTHWEDQEQTVSHIIGPREGARDWAEKNAAHFGVEIEDLDGGE